MIEYQVNINGIDVQARYTETSVENIFRPLLLELTRMQRMKKRRILAMLAAPPGAGKSTLLSFLSALADDIPDVGSVQVIGMDGFHRRQEYLITHTTVRDGQEIRMVDIKGAPETFDLESLRKRIEKVAAGEHCGWPVYDRHLHNPTDNVIQVTEDIVILEGNYLLLDRDGWRELADYADYTILIRAGEELLRKRLIARKTASGYPEEKARKFVEFSDMANVKECMEHNRTADLVLTLDPDGTYRL